MYLAIFDRWGNRIYYTENFTADGQTGWDGTFKNEPLNPAVFAYVAEVLFNSGDVRVLKGTITLVR